VKQEIQFLVIPYSQKYYWRELNLAVEPKIAIAGILVDLIPILAFYHTNHPPPRYNGQKHVKVFLFNGLYGFHESMCIYRTLMDLVLHYSENSLEVLDHNPPLTTTLKYPVKADT
jgi:hypothetical protein